MTQVLTMLYLWLKAGHVIFVVFWMAGLFMLPRFFVYHQELPENAPENAMWVEREQRLLKIILWPSLILVWVLGMALAVSGGWFTQGWMHAKLAVVMALTAYQVWMADYARNLAFGRRKLAGKQLRLVNEVPGVAAAIIIILVIVKPF
jgi:putative membrane protein